MHVTITWNGLKLDVSGEYEPDDDSVGVSESFIVEEVYCQGARQYAIETLEECLADIETLVLARLYDDAAEYEAERRAAARGIDF